MRVLHAYNQDLLDDFVQKVAHNRNCRSFHGPTVTIVVPDEGIGFTCVTDKYALDGASPCYFVPSSDILEDIN